MLDHPDSNHLGSCHSEHCAWRRLFLYNPEDPDKIETDVSRWNCVDFKLNHNFFIVDKLLSDIISSPLSRFVSA